MSCAEAIQLDQALQPPLNQKVQKSATDFVAQPWHSMQPRNLLNEHIFTTLVLKCTTEN